MKKLTTSSAISLFDEIVVGVDKNNEFYMEWRYGGKKIGGNKLSRMFKKIIDYGADGLKNTAKYSFRPIFFKD